MDTNSFTLRFSVLELYKSVDISFKIETKSVGLVLVLGKMLIVCIRIKKII